MELENPKVFDEFFSAVKNNNSQAVLKIIEKNPALPRIADFVKICI